MKTQRNQKKNYVAIKEIEYVIKILSVKDM